ncbi:hypothetical protein C8R43DRAFT_1022844 [Mycena crocata]|nr:hypothetical protein C8R43DRAFT_1022844 [Mycena crocata]
MEHLPSPAPYDLVNGVDAATQIDGASGNNTAEDTLTDADIESIREESTVIRAENANADDWSAAGETIEVGNDAQDLPSIEFLREPQSRSASPVLMSRKRSVRTETGIVAATSTEGTPGPRQLTFYNQSQATAQLAGPHQQYHTAVQAPAPSFLQPGHNDEYPAIRSPSNESDVAGGTNEPSRPPVDGEAEAVMAPTDFDLHPTETELLPHDVDQTPSTLESPRVSPHPEANTLELANTFDALDLPPTPPPRQDSLIHPLRSASYLTGNTPQTSSLDVGVRSHFTRSLVHGRVEKVSTKELDAAHELAVANVGALPGPPALGLSSVAVTVERLRVEMGDGDARMVVDSDPNSTNTWTHRGSIEARPNTAPTAAYTALLEETFGPGSALRGEGPKPIGRRREGKAAGRGSPGTGIHKNRSRRGSPGTGASSRGSPGSARVTGGRGRGSPGSTASGSGLVDDVRRMDVDGVDTDASSNNHNSDSGEADGDEVISRAEGWIAEIQVLLKGKRQMTREDLKSVVSTLRAIADMDAAEGHALGNAGPRLFHSLWELAQMQDIPFRDEHNVRGWARRLVRHWPELS